MLDYLLDNLNRVIGDPRSPRWKRVIDAFLITYPEVDIETSPLWTNNAQNFRVPKGFLVWRIGRDGIPSDVNIFSENRWVHGAYVVQLFPALGVTARINTRERGLYVTNVKEAGNRTVITAYGDFQYDAPIGELTKSWPGSFYQMVLEEDARKFCDMGNRTRKNVR